MQEALGSVEAIPVAVGSGTINDLTKLAAHRLGRPYLVVATAASMDGYTAYGASITANGSKQTFDCPAPRAVLADLEVIAGAPGGMNASGYADLLAKNVAGATGSWPTPRARSRSTPRPGRPSRGGSGPGSARPGRSIRASPRPSGAWSRGS